MPGMELDQVAVFDGNGNDVSVSDGETSVSGSDAEEIAAVIENQMKKRRYMMSLALCMAIRM